MKIIERKKRAVEAEVSETPDFPKEIFFDLTSCCNHACVFCANPLIKNKITMKPDKVKRLLKEAYDCGVRDLGLYATGESFLVNKLPEYIKFAKGIGYEYLFITTNGALATPIRAKQALDAGLDSIKFSISAGTRESYEKIHGKDDFDKVIDNLKWVSRYRDESQLSYRIYVTMVYTDKTKDEVKLLKDIVMPYIDEWDPHSLNNQCGNMHENNELMEINANDPRGRGKRNICFQPFKGFSITPEGYMSACVLDYSKDLIVADLNKTTMLEAWNNEIYRSFRRKHIEGNLKDSICFNCVNNKNEPVVALMPEYAQHFKSLDILDITK